jgi:nicotinamide phosphoribosyltransferase
MFLADGYKAGHYNMYQDGVEVVYSNFTPRANKYAPKGNNGKVLNFGHQYAIRFIVEHFNENFFSKPKEQIISEIKENFSAYLGVDYDTKHIEDLWDLGYLPLEIRSLDEGTESAIKIPVMFLYNTDERFAWVTNYIETILSNLLWQPITTATNVLIMKRIVKDAVLKTDKDNLGIIDFMLHDFSMRGLTGLDATIGSGMAFASDSKGSDSLPAIKA